MDHQRVEARETALARYKLNVAGFVAFLALSLLTVVDFRRGFLFSEYVHTSPYFAFRPLHIAMLAVAVFGLFVFYRRIRRQESGIDPVSLGKYLKALAFILFGMLALDGFTYRLVPAGRAISAGKIGAGWLDAFGVTGWLKPAALSLSYLATVWHATFLGVLLSGLALTILPRYLTFFFNRRGFSGSLSGALFALPQPFCSCCASVIAPSLIRRGASGSFSLAFLVASPMLNVSTLILAAALLPTRYALIRILGGLLLATLGTYTVALLSEGRDLRNGAGDACKSQNGSCSGRASRWLNLYLGFFRLEDLLHHGNLDSPGTFVRAWFSVSLRIAAILIPTQLIWSLVTAAVVQALPSAFGNNFWSVVLSATAGTLLMISTWTEIPVALQMLQAGFTGPAATLLLVLPAVSLPCLMLLSGALGRIREACLLGFMAILTGVLTGLLFL